MAKNISKCLAKGGVLVLSGLQINDESKVKSMYFGTWFGFFA